MKKERMWGVGLGLKLFLLVSMAAANILSLYHLSSLSRTPSHSSSPAPLQDLLDQLQAVRSTISRLTRSRPSPPPPELLLYSQISPIASSCSDHPDLLHPFMTYTPFSPCPASSLSIAESLLLRGCHPLPRRRCFDISPSSKPHISSPKPQISSRSVLDLPLAQLLAIAAATGASPIRLGLDIAGGDGALAADLKLAVGATVLTTTMDLGRPLSQAAAALRGVVPLHAPLQQRLPVHDGCLDLIRAGHAVNRWIPLPALEFLLFDADRLLRPGGLLWIDRFSCRDGDLGAAYAPAIGRLGYRRIKWSVGNKTGTRRGGEVYLTALLQKPRPPPPVPAAGGRGGIGRD